MLQSVGELGALRPRADEAHFPLEHIPQLRDLINTKLAHQAPDTSDSGILKAGELCTSRLGVDHHGSELEHVEGTTVLTGPDLSVENRQART